MIVKVNPGAWVGLDNIAHVNALKDGRTEIVTKAGGVVHSEVSAEELARLSAPVVPAFGIGDVISWRVLPEGVEPVLSKGGVHD